MNDDISQLLHDAAPEGPSPDAWAEGARRQSNRRRTIGGVVAAMAAVALIVPLAGALKGPDTTIVQATPSSASPSDVVESAPGPLQPSECLDGEGRMVVPTEMPPDPLPAGVARIWLCAETLEWARSTGAFAVVGAPEPLTIGVEQAVEAYNALGVGDGKVMSCPAPWRYEAAVVVEYPNGERVILRGSDSGCDGIGGREGWRSYLATLTELWTSQRETLGTAFTRDVQVCPATESLLYPRADRATRGYACPHPTNDDAKSSQRALPADLVADIAEEIGGPLTLQEEGWPPDAGSPTLVLLNAYGDPVWLTQTHAELGTPPEWRWAEADGVHGWTPSDDLARRMEEELHAGPSTNVTPSESPVTPSPAPPVPHEVELVSYRQATLAAAHPDVFAGWGFSDDDQTAELYYGEAHASEAQELAAEFTSDGALAALIPRRHSWSDLLAQRHEVLRVLEERGIEAVEAVPDPRESDGILLVVAQEKLNEDGSVGTDADWSDLTAAGVVKAEVDSFPAPREVAGIPVDVDPRSWFNLPLADVDINGTTAIAVLQRRMDVYAGAAFSPFYDYVEIWVQQDHLVEARELLEAADLDMDLIRLIPVPLGFDDLSALSLTVFDEATSYGLYATGVNASVEDGGAILWLDDLAQLETLAPEKLQSLVQSGLVGVMQMGVATAMPLQVTPEPTPS